MSAMQPAMPPAMHPAMPPGILKQSKYNTYSPLYNTSCDTNLRSIDKTIIYNNVDSDIESNIQKYHLHTLVEDYDKALYNWLLSILIIIFCLICILITILGYKRIFT